MTLRAEWGRKQVQQVDVIGGFRLICNRPLPHYWENSVSVSIKLLCEQIMEVSNPTVEEIRQWAYSDEEWPHDEWDLFLSWTREVDLFIELATDHKCPKRLFFLHMLYYIIGTTFNEPSKTDKLQRINDYAEKGAGVNHGDIRAWRIHIGELLSGRDKYSYENWRGGVYAGYRFT